MVIKKTYGALTNAFKIRHTHLCGGIPLQHPTAPPNPLKVFGYPAQACLQSLKVNYTIQDAVITLDKEGMHTFRSCYYRWVVVAMVSTTKNRYGTGNEPKDAS